MCKVMVVSNGRAGRVSARTAGVLASALSADFDVHAIETAARHHATELAREAVSGGFDAVVAYGGDGTVNETAQPLVGTGVALGILPGGSTNVVARLLGLPQDPVEAAALVATRLRSGIRRRINVGSLNGRYFLLAAGMGLDGEVVKRVEADPEGKRRHGEWVFLSHALRAGLRHYLWADPRVTVRVDGAPPARVVLAVVCNARPLTYFKRWAVDACPYADLQAGLDVFGLQRVGVPTIPRLVWSLFVTKSHVRWKKASYYHDLASVTLEADEPIPVQVDGDYIGDHSRVRLELVESSLDLLA